jgi:hypothetical protein
MRSWTNTKISRRLSEKKRHPVITGQRPAKNLSRILPLRVYASIAKTAIPVCFLDRPEGFGIVKNTNNKEKISLIAMESSKKVA